MDNPASKALNKLATRQGLVLLKNSPLGGINATSTAGRGVLPFAKGRGRVAVVGPHANARRALVGNYLGQICPESDGSYACVQSPAAAFAAANGGEGSVLVAEGCSIDGKDKSGFSAALAAAHAAETGVVMMMGLDTSSVEREGHDRTTLGVP